MKVFRFDQSTAQLLKNPKDWLELGDCARHGRLGVELGSKRIRFRQRGRRKCTALRFCTQSVGEGGGTGRAVSMFIKKFSEELHSALSK